MIIPPLERTARKRRRQFTHAHVSSNRLLSACSCVRSAHLTYVYSSAVRGQEARTCRRKKNKRQVLVVLPRMVVFAALLFQNYKLPPRKKIFTCIYTCIYIYVSLRLHIVISRIGTKISDRRCRTEPPRGSVAGATTNTTAQGIASASTTAPHTKQQKKAAEEVKIQEGGRLRHDLLNSTASLCTNT